MTREVCGRHHGAMEKLDLSPESFLETIGFRSTGEKDRLLIEQVLFGPTCDINAPLAAIPGGSKTVSPPKPGQNLVRLVEGQQPEKIRKAFPRLTSRARACRLRRRITDHSRHGDRASTEHEPLPPPGGAMTDEWGKEALLIGSGLDPDRRGFKRTSGLDTVLVGFGLERQHPFAQRKI